MPWSVGLATLLLLGLATAVLVGRTDDSALRVPQALLDFQEQIGRDAAQSVRRSLNEGVNDLDQVARVLAVADAARPADLHGPLREFARAHSRYVSVIAVDRRGAVVARAGARPGAGFFRAAAAAQQPGMHEIPRVAGQPPLIEQFAPVTSSRSRVRALIGHYDARFLRHPLDVARPGNASVVNGRGQIVGTRIGHARLETLPRQALRQAAARGAAAQSGAQSVGGSLDSQEVIGFAPVSGPGPAGRLGWSVVATRDIGSFALPQTDARRQGLLIGVATAVLALLIFGWLHVVVVAPVLRMQREAERVARGDLSRTVHVVRYDEIGLIGRALERVRIRLIRSRTAGPRGTERKNGNKRRASSLR